MGLLGDFAKGFVIMTVVFWIFAIIEFIYITQIALALLFLIGLIIPLSIIGYEYLKNRKVKATNRKLGVKEVAIIAETLNFKGF